MREILFRGKRVDNGEWAESTYPFGTMSSGAVVHDFDPTTVGQYTGLTDKNGKKIFEGDIVYIIGNKDVDEWKDVGYTALIMFLDGGFCAIDGTEKEYTFRRYALSRMDFSIEIIGNIYDNPELLDGAYTNYGETGVEYRHKPNTTLDCKEEEHEADYL